MGRYARWEFRMVIKTPRAEQVLRTEPYLTEALGIRKRGRGRYLLIVINMLIHSLFPKWLQYSWSKKSRWTLNKDEQTQAHIDMSCHVTKLSEQNVNHATNDFGQLNYIAASETILLLFLANPLRGVFFSTLPYPLPHP